MIENYKIVSVPIEINKDFNKMSENDSNNYLNWLLSIKEERKQHILQVSNTLLTNRKETLERLFHWFGNNITFRNKTDEELKTERDFYKDIVVVKKTLSIETISICFDIGLLWGDLLIKEKKNLKWVSYYEDKRSLEFAQPVIKSFNSNNDIDMVNPRSLIEVIASKIMNNKRLEDEFNKKLDIWKTELFGN